VAALLPADTGQLTLTRDTLVRDPRSRHQLPGCVARLAATRSALGHAASPDQRVRAGLAALGWRENLQYSADGPDGTAFAFWLGTATCFVEARWDGGDDADPASGRGDDYLLIIGCAVEP